ncbi:helix-turn-helix domain-containing protein [Lutispora thermophila]|uniref:helix-turn-helix domain-containing protein n=1 Tax=Lutispora thermophila TaxID=288966 RepID=UPI0009FEC24F
MVNIEKYITTKELCEWLKISHNTANNWRRKGLPYIRVGNTVRYDKEQVQKWLNEQSK